MKRLLQAWLVLASASSVVSELASSVMSGLLPLTIKGSKIFQQDGAQFFIKGIQIFSPASFSLVSPKQCKADADLARSLGVNSVRFEDIGTHNHGECMKIYADAGIYVWAGLDGFGESSRGVCLWFHSWLTNSLPLREACFWTTLSQVQIDMAKFLAIEFLISPEILRF